MLFKLYQDISFDGLANGSTGIDVKDVNGKPMIALKFYDHDREKIAMMIYTPSELQKVADAINAVLAGIKPENIQGVLHA